MKSKFDLKESLLYRMTTRDQSALSKFDLKESYVYRMTDYEKKTVPELKAIAKQRGMVGYSRLRKRELISILSPPNVGRGHENNLLDAPVPSTSTPVLTPIPASLDKIKKSVKTLGNKIKSEINSFANWIANYIPPPVKAAVNDKVEDLKMKVNNIFNTVYKNVNFKALMKKTEPYKIKEPKTAIRGFTKQYTIDGSVNIDAESFLNAVQPLVINILEANQQTKVNFVLTCTMERADINSGQVSSVDVPFVSKTEVHIAATDVGNLYKNACDKILESMASFQMHGSNWRFKSVSKLDINTVVYKPLNGSSYIPLPDNLAAKKAIINMKNDDNECFKWCITRALNPIDKNQERITKELVEQSKKLCWSGVEFPVAADENIYYRFERNNNTSLNVFGYETNIYPLYLSKHQSAKIVDLLFISDGVKKHYCWIKNFNKLLARRNDKSHNSMHYCKRCLLGYRTIEALSKHNEYCSQHDAQKIAVPELGTILKFKNYNRSMRVPFIVYADFESFIKPVSTCQPDPYVSYTNKYQKHMPSSFSYYVKCFDDSVYSQPPQRYTAESEDDDIAQKFVDTLEENIKQIYKKFKFPRRMIYTDSHKVCFEKATECHICGGELGDDRVRDHCHFSGRFRGAAHNSCNINYKEPKFIPVVLHNLSGYDSHLFIKKLRGSNGEKINCIPINEEKYISFSREVVVDKFVNKEIKEVLVKRELRFIDSFRFMASGLDTLSKNLHKVQYKNLSKFYSGKQLDLLLRKGVYPYDYVESVKKLDETELPPKSAFYSKLNDSNISDEDYEHAKVVWKEFGFKTLKEYHDLYNVSDVLLLADVFENFRDVCMEHYRLDPAWYYTSPGLAWDAALKMTSVELELLSDYDMILMIKHGTRGGISTISNRYAKANNKYMGYEFDNTKPSSFITYLDANNLYGWAMSKPLPTHGFKWMTTSQLNNWKNISTQAGVGCIMEVDLEYPSNLHDLHNDYPLAPESITVEGSKVSKLIPNLNDKKKYVVHYENLKLYESLGLKVAKIHRGIVFNERPWLKMYIDLNTELRTKATNDFEKDFFKLMNNSVFGKTMENIENRVDVRLVCDEKEAIKLAAKANYDSRTIFDENLIAVHMKRIKLFYNKPIYLGMCILDLSKTLMYDFHYNYLKNKYRDRAKLLFTDTDSLAYEIKTVDFYADIADDVESRFDTSDYPEDHGSGIMVGVNKKVIGMFKDEAGGKQIDEFVGLRAKLYSYKIHEKENKKCKGVKRNVVEKTITHDDYKNCLFTKTEQLRTMNVIRSHLHDIYTEEVNKVALSADDDKRIIMEDGMHTLAYGHYILRM